MSAIAETVKIGAVTLQVQYTSNALRRLENNTGKTVQLIGLTLVSSRAGWGLLQDILWAGLEGARLKHATRAQPFTVEEVGDMIDDAGGPVVFWDESSEAAQAILRAWQSAFPQRKREGENSSNPPPASDAPSESTGKS